MDELFEDARDGADSRIGAWDLELWVIAVQVVEEDVALAQADRLLRLGGGPTEAFDLYQGLEGAGGGRQFEPIS